MATNELPAVAVCNQQKIRFFQKGFSLQSGLWTLRKKYYISQEEYL